MLTQTRVYFSPGQVQYTKCEEFLRFFIQGLNKGLFRSSLNCRLTTQFVRCRKDYFPLDGSSVRKLCWKAQCEVGNFLSKLESCSHCLFQFPTIETSNCRTFGFFQLYVSSFSNRKFRLLRGLSGPLIQVVN